MIHRLMVGVALACSACVTGGPSPAAVQASYEAVLWQMMFLEHCSSRWNSPQELAQAQARVTRLQTRASATGQSGALESAQQRHNGKMVRVDTSCRDGIAAQLEKTMAALAVAEAALLGTPGEDE